LQERVLEIGEVEEGLARDRAKEALGKVAKQISERAGENPPAKVGEHHRIAGARKVLGDVEPPLEDDSDGRVKRAGEEARHEAGKQHLPRVLLVEEQQRRGHPTHENDGEEDHVEPEKARRHEGQHDVDQERRPPIERESDPERYRGDRHPELGEGGKEEDALDDDHQPEARREQAGLRP